MRDFKGLVVGVRGVLMVGEEWMGENAI
jgi:hypothetical protein